MIELFLFYRIGKTICPSRITKMMCMCVITNNNVTRITLIKVVGFQLIASIALGQPNREIHKKRKKKSY